MVNKLMHFDMQTTTTQTRVDNLSMFTDEGTLSATGLIENMAQTCAARIGYINKYILKRDVQPGVIAAIKNMKVHALPQVSDTITTTVSIAEEVFGMSLLNVEVKNAEGRLIAIAELKMKV